MARKVDTSHIGEVYDSKQGKMKIVEYNSRTDVWIEFQDEYKAKVHSTMQHIRNGRVANPYAKTVYGVGCLGNVDFKVVVNGKRDKRYMVWYNMIRRCYDIDYQRKHGLTEQKIVCERWLCFEYFLQDLPLIENYDMWLNGEKVKFDCDIKQQYSYEEVKVYSLKTCMFITQGMKKMLLEY